MRLPQLTKPWRLAVYAAMGAFTFLFIYGVAALDVSNEQWIFRLFPEGDIAQTYAGWVAYKDEPWAFPLGRIESLSWPDGTTTAYTNSNPLVCVLLKLFAPILPATFQFIGWYTLICHILQGLAAGLIVELYTDKVTLGVPAVLLFTFSPIMMDRVFRHINLGAQFIEVFAIYLYLAMRREGYKRLRWQFAVLSVVAMGFTPYHLPLVFAVQAVVAIEYIRTRRNVWKPLAYLATNAAVALAAGWALGSIGWVAGTQSRSGYGDYSLNLNAPFNPTSLGNYSWSALLPVQGQFKVQYDGFNYLGLGVLVAGVFILGHWLYTMARQGAPFHKAALENAGRFCRRHWPLLAVCLCMTLIAVTHRVTLGEQLLFEVPLPGFVLELLNIFRASARMFYLPYYCIFVFVVRYLLVHFRVKISRLLLAAMIVLQVGDMYGVIIEKHIGMRETPQPSVLTDDLLNAMADAMDYEYFIFAEHKQNNEMLLFAALYDMETNNQRMSSGTYPAARALEDEAYEMLKRGEYEENTMYVVRNEPEHYERAHGISPALENKNVVLYNAYGYLFVLPQPS